MILCPAAWLGPFFSSLWWRSPPDISSVTLDHDVLCKLPSHRGGGQPIQLTRSLLCRTTVEIRHPRMGFPTLPQLSAAAELFVINLVAHHNPQPDSQFPGRRDPGLAHSFLDELAPIEAFQLRVFPYCVHRRFGPQVAQQRVAL